MGQPHRGVAIVTGASSGLGRSLALELVHAGYSVAIVGRNEKALKLLATGLPENAQTRVKAIKADLTNDSEVSTLVARCEAALGKGPVDLLVNCAGYAVMGRAEDIPLEDYRRCWKVNFEATVSLCQQVLPAMRARKAGTIVNVSSGVARRALPYAAPYCSAKAALNSYTESLRVELMNSGVTLLLFSPGPVASNFHEATVHRGSTKIAFPPFHGKSANEVGKKLFEAIENRKDRVVLGGKASIAYHLNYWIPRITDRIVSRMYKIEDVSETPRLKQAGHSK